jgi:acyl carrier protein
MALPTLDDVVQQLQSVSGAQELDPDAPLLENEDIDSLDLMEWLYTFQEQYPEVPADESLFEDIDSSVTLRAIYTRVMDTVPASASGA